MNQITGDPGFLKDTYLDMTNSDIVTNLFFMLFLFFFAAGVCVFTRHLLFKKREDLPIAEVIFCDDEEIVEAEEVITRV